MNDLRLKLTGGTADKTLIYVDDQLVKVKKNEFGSLVSQYRTNKSQVNVKVYQIMDVGGVAWFLTQLLFFLISLFGILDVHHKANCFSLDFEAVVDLQTDNQITLQLNAPRENTPAITVQTALPCREIVNQYTLDPHAQQTFRRLKFAKIGLLLALLAISTIVLLGIF